MARSCQDIYANRGSSRLSFRLYALRFSWRICIRWIDSLSSISFPLSRWVHSFYFYLLLATYTCEYVYIYIYIEPPRNARQYRPICIRDASLQPLSNFPFLFLSLSLSLHAPINRCRDERSFPRWPCLSCSTGLKWERVARLNEIDCLRKNKWNAWYKLCTVTRTLSYSKILCYIYGMDLFLLFFFLFSENYLRELILRIWIYFIYFISCS